METMDLDYYDHFVGRTLCIVDQRHQIDGPDRPMSLVKAAARFHLQNLHPAPGAALHRPPPPIGYNQVSLLPAQLQRVMIGCVASACHLLAAQPPRLKLHDGEAWRWRTFILVRVLAGYTRRVQRTVVDYRAAAAARIERHNRYGRYIDDMSRIGIDSAVFRDHIIANPSWVCAKARGRTPLMIAADHGLVDCCRFAIDAGADVNTRDSGEGTLGCTALHAAANMGHVDVCRLLVASGADATLSCKHCTLLFHAVSNGHLDVCRYLVEQGADVNFKYPVDESRGWPPAKSAMCIAIQRGGFDVLRYLVGAGADVSAGCCDATTPLSFAASQGTLDMCRYLLDVGADVNAAGDGIPALHKAACRAREETCVDVCRLLVQRGADVNARDEEGRTALHMSAEHLYIRNNVECCRFLIEAGADIKAEDDAHRTVMHVVAKHGQVQMCRYLVDIGANVNAKSCHGTPLHVALVCSDMENGMAQLLVESGADVYAVDDKGRTLLHAACGRSLSLPARARFAVEAGVGINAVDHDGCTALLLAAKEGNLEIVQYLVEAGADVEATDNSGATAFEYASKAFIFEWGRSIQIYLRNIGAPAPEKFRMRGT
jgi:ankyrin repeat protein